MLFLTPPGCLQDYKEKKLSLALLAVTAGSGTAELRVTSHLPALPAPASCLILFYTPRHTTHHTTPRITLLWPALHHTKCKY